MRARGAGGARSYATAEEAAGAAAGLSTITLQENGLVARVVRASPVPCVLCVVTAAPRARAQVALQSSLPPPPTGDAVFGAPSRVLELANMITLDDVRAAAAARRGVRARGVR